MKTVLITGATGFVGGHIVTRLIERGDSVRAVVRRPAPWLSELGVEVMPGGFGGVGATQLTDVDGVVHVAASFSGDLDEARTVNRDGTQRLARLAVEAGVPRFVHMSTTATYDLPAIGDAVVDETAPLRDVDSAPNATGSAPPTYGATKAEAEAEIRAARRSGLSAAILRPPAVLGAGETSTWGSRVPRQLLDGSGFARHRDSTFAWVHVDDLATATLAALDIDRDLTVNVVGGHETVGDYLRRVVATLPGDITITDVDQAPWRGRYAVDRLGDELDVVPQHSFDEAMDEIATWWAARIDDTQSNDLGTGGRP